MSDTKKSTLDLLIEVLSDCPDLKITFSKNCVSGLVGRGVCACWRCREDGLENPGWERAAELISEGFNCQTARAIRIREREAKSA